VYRLMRGAAETQIRNFRVCPVERQRCGCERVFGELEVGVGDDVLVHPYRAGPEQQDDGRAAEREEALFLAPRDLGALGMVLADAAHPHGADIDVRHRAEHRRRQHGQLAIVLAEDRFHALQRERADRPVEAVDRLDGAMSSIVDVAEAVVVDRREPQHDAGAAAEQSLPFRMAQQRGHRERPPLHRRHGVDLDRIGQHAGVGR